MKDRPNLTIIVPMYNREAYICECVTSIQQQTYTDWELLLVDDASTDETVAICRNLQRFDDRIKIFKQMQNQGVSAARNCGLQAAQGKYVTFVDSDDYLMPDGLAHMMKLASAGQADVVWSRGRFYERGEGQTLIPEWDGAQSDQDIRVLPADIGTRLEVIFEHSGWMGAVWNRVYRSDFLKNKQLHFEKLSANEDTLFNFLCLCKARKYIVTSQLYYVYRLSRDSILRKKKTLDDLEKHVQDTFRFAELLWRNLGTISYFADNPEVKEKVMESITRYMLEMPRQWGFFPTPSEHRQIVAESVCTAMEPYFGDKAWLVQYLYRQWMENQGSVHK